MSKKSAAPKPLTNKKTLSALKLFPISYDLVKKNWQLIGLLYAPIIALTILDGLNRISDEQNQGYGLANLVSNAIAGPNGGTVIGNEDAFVIFILNALSILGALLLVPASIRIIQGKQPMLQDIWKEFTANGLWLRLIGLILIMGVFIISGLVALVIPGIYIMYRTFMAPYILIDKGVGIEESLRQSWRLTKGYSSAILSIILVIILISVPSILPTIGGLIALALTMAYALAPALRYKEIK